MSIISKETWNNIPKEEKEKLIELYYNSVKVDFGIMRKIFPEEALQPKPLTYEDVAMNLFLDKQFYRFNGDGGVFCDDYRVYSNDDYWNPLNCLSQKQAEKLLAINKLLNVAAYLNKGWQPDWEYVQNKWYLAVEKGKIKVDYHDDSHNSHIVYFRTEELAKQAIQILGEEVIRLALTTEY